MAKIILHSERRLNTPKEILNDQQVYVGVDVRFGSILLKKAAVARAAVH